MTSSSSILPSNSVDPPSRVSRSDGSSSTSLGGEIPPVTQLPSLHAALASESAFCARRMPSARLPSFHFAEGRAGPRAT